MAEASWRRLSRAAMLATAIPVETYTWGPRPAILNDLSRDEETEAMDTVGEGRAGDAVGADQADVGVGRIKQRLSLAEFRCAR